MKLKLFLKCCEHYQCWHHSIPSTGFWHLIHFAPLYVISSFLDCAGCKFAFYVVFHFVGFNHHNCVSSSTSGSVLFIKLCFYIFMHFIQDLLIAFHFCPLFQKFGHSMVKITGKTVRVPTDLDVLWPLQGPPPTITANFISSCSWKILVGEVRATVQWKKHIESLHLFVHCVIWKKTACISILARKFNSILYSYCIIVGIGFLL